jgi:hypothetical protein
MFRGSKDGRDSAFLNFRLMARALVPTTSFNLPHQSEISLLINSLKLHILNVFLLFKSED